MDPDKPGGENDRYSTAICISSCLGYCKSLVDRLVRGLQAEQETERRILKYFTEK